jgi:hypothetical protein
LTQHLHQPNPNGFPDIGQLKDGCLVTGKQFRHQVRALIGYRVTGRGINGFPVTGQAHHLLKNIGHPDIVGRADAGFRDIGGKYKFMPVLKIIEQGNKINCNQKESRQS